MSTVQLERPGLTRVAQLRHTTPGRLQLTLFGLLALGLLTGLLVFVTANQTRSGTDDLGDRAQPLLVEAETIYSALADADTTAAQAFLAGGLEPADLTRQYEDDLTRVSTALTAAARRTPEGSEPAESIRALSTGVTRYAALVASARANNRQGMPVGSAYLSQASALNRETLQPQAQALFRIAEQETDRGYGSAKSTAFVVLYALLLISLTIALIHTQVRLSRSTKRTFNIPLACATALTLLLGLISTGVLVAQRNHLGDADSEGSTPVALLAQARIFALRERGDEALTLAARGNGAQYEQDFDTASQRLSGPNGLLAVAAGAVDGPAGQWVRSAMRKHDIYVGIHEEVRAKDESGDHDGAVDLAIGADTSATFRGLTDDIGRALEDRKNAFDREIDAAGRGLGSLTVLGPLLALAVCALAILGLRPRLEEYR
ncbi:hypothetical protein AB0M20_30065 [Actinoplanes sp. NPDC051633]|uniref:hypothetical protein n=1 Tax=Actinoplanes sp. NPDC051633 TaxID=3155670 RepID=UPI0034331422